MPDINMPTFNYAEGAAVQVTVPDTVINAIIESDGEEIANYTGPNALHYPAMLANLTPAQRAALMEQIAQAFTFAIAGVE